MLFIYDNIIIVKLKKIISYLVLFSYTIIILKPVLPVASDTLAHVFWKLEHISTVHSHDGDDHVHQEIIKTEAQDKQGKTTIPPRYEVSVNPHLITNISYDFLIVPGIQIHNTSSLLYHPQASTEQDDPPPKV